MYSQALFSPAPPPGLRPGLRPLYARHGPAAAPLKLVRQ
jgi:hypothetical protein